MKHLPHLSGLLYGMPWAILPTVHQELSSLYQSYLRGTLPPRADSGEDDGEGGLDLEADPTSRIAVIHATGVIGKRIPPMPCGPPVIDLAALDTLLDTVSRDPGITTLLLDLNTPGGTTVGLTETANRLRDLSAAGRRTIAYTDYQMCSAGYYLACACDEIYAAPSSVIGSIGTYCAAIDDTRQWEMEGLRLILAKSGDLKAMGHPGKPWEPAEIALLQQRADQAGAEFRAHVTAARGAVPPESMQGQWFFAADAHPTLLDGLYPDLPALLAELL